MLDVELVWEDPPNPPRKADVVAALLLERPGEWARIATSEALVLRPWWVPLRNDERFEVRLVPQNPDRWLGPMVVYARARGGSEVHD